MKVTIYHNPHCGTSRNTLALIRQAGIEPTVIEYLKDPPDRAALESLLSKMHLAPRQLLREKESLFAKLNLADASLPDAALIEAMLKHPKLMNRPIVVTALGAKLCRPADAVLGLLPKEPP